MKVTVKMTGGPAFVGQFRLLDLAAATRLEKVVAASTKNVERGAHARLSPHNRTGELDATIRSSAKGLQGRVMAGRGEMTKRGAARRRTKSGAIAKDGKGVYAPVVEFGSQNPVRPAEPFLFPSAEAERPQFIAASGAALQGAVADTERA